MLLQTPRNTLDSQPAHRVGAERAALLAVSALPPSALPRSVPTALPPPVFQSAEDSVRQSSGPTSGSVLTPAPPRMGELPLRW